MEGNTESSLPMINATQIEQANSILQEVIYLCNLYPIVSTFFFLFFILGFLVDYYSNKLDQKNTYIWFSNVLYKFGLILFFYFLYSEIYKAVNIAYNTDKLFPLNGDGKALPSLEYYQIIMVYFSGTLIWASNLAFKRLKAGVRISCLHAYFIAYLLLTIDVYLSAIYYFNVNVSDISEIRVINSYIYVITIGFLFFIVFSFVLFTLWKGFSKTLFYEKG